MGARSYVIVAILFWVVMHSWLIISSSSSTVGNRASDEFLRRHDRDTSSTKTAVSPRINMKLPNNKEAVSPRRRRPNNKTAVKPRLNINRKLPNHNRIPLSRRRRVESGWDDAGLKLYRDRVRQLSDIGWTNVTFSEGLGGRHFVASDDVAGNVDFWHNAANEMWERETFLIFNRYIGESTTVVDFGTWIGPTLLFHGQFSKASYGMEADPAAYAVAEHNVELNEKHNPSWGGRVSVDSGCVSRPEDVGTMAMRASGSAGVSTSGIGEHVFQQFRDVGKSPIRWEVRCYTLPDLFDDYWGIRKPYEDVFLKIDVESYECKLVPSFYDWLREETHLPTMYVSFHPQFAECTDEEYLSVAKFFALYDHVAYGDRDDDPFVEDKVYSVTYRKKTHYVTYPEYVKGKIRQYKFVVLYQNHHAVKKKEDAKKKEERKLSVVFSH